MSVLCLCVSCYHVATINVSKWGALLNLVKVLVAESQVMWIYQANQIMWLIVATFPSIEPTLTLF